METQSLSPVIWDDDMKRRMREHKHQLKLARRRANRHNRSLTKKLKREKIGNLFLAETRTRLAPYNIKGETTYLIAAGTKVLAEKTQQSYTIYLGFWKYKTLAEIKANCKKLKWVRKEELKFNYHNPIKLD